MTNQELFTNTWQHHVVEGNPPGYDVGSGACQYRGPRGEACAIGCSFPPDLNTESFEGALAGCLIIDDEDYLGATRERQRAHTILDGVDVEFAEKLQDTHDRIAREAEGDRVSFQKRYGTALKKIGRAHNLIIPSNSD